MYSATQSLESTSCLTLLKLEPGKITLPGVPLFEDAVEVATPERRARITMDVIVERGLIEIRRSDKELFNVHDYRSDSPHGPLVPHVTFEHPVEAVILSQDASDLWCIDGKDLRISDLAAARNFVKKVGAVAAQQ